jgi:hypothetical protein
MMNLRFLAAAPILTIGLLTAVGLSHAQETDIVAGRIVSVHCSPAFLRKNGTQKGVPLVSPRDIGMPLSAGDQVQCAKGDYLEVLVSDGTKKIPPPSSPDQWFPIGPLPPSPVDSKEDTEITKELRGYGIVGATRGNAATSRILWPAEGSAVMPENLVVRWAPVSRKVSLSILTDAKDMILWKSDPLDGSAGVLKSAAASAALAAFKKKSPNARLVLTITFGNESDWEEVHFSFLSAQQEQDLDAQLDFWAKHTGGLTLHLGRGYAYTRHKLFAEAADEYETALESAPESPYLLKDAIDADQRAGRGSRVKELQSRLASLPPAANP